MSAEHVEPLSAARGRPAILFPWIPLSGFVAVTRRTDGNAGRITLL